MREIDYWIWLSSLEGIGAVKAKVLLDIYKHPREIYQKSEQELRGIKQISAKNIEELLDKGKRERVSKIYELMVHYNIKMLNILDNTYPNKLKQIYDPPIALFYRGKFNIDEFAIAIVGSRKTTSYGCLCTKKLSYDLAYRGIQIISGLARGIDSIAHEGCLNAGGNTIAVLGCGLDVIYPPENKKLFEDIIMSGGLVMSEYPPGMPPLQHNFPARNRIISGLSSGIVVIEAAKRSGSLITATYALEQGREVFAVPGNIDCAYSRGTNQLIKDGAKMVLCAEDILEEFEYDVDRGKSENTTKTNFNLFRGLSTEEIKILKIIINGIHQIDEIIESSKTSVQETNNILFMLEMKGVITQYPGKRFELNSF